MDFQPKEHAIFLDGYLDALGKSYDCKTAVRFLQESETIESVLGASSSTSEQIETISTYFEKELSELLNEKPNNKTLFYAVEYIAWFKEFSESFTCHRYRLNGQNIPTHYIAYMITCNYDVSILIYVYK